MTDPPPPVLGHARGVWHKAVLCLVIRHRLIHIPPEEAGRPRRYTFCTRCGWRQWYRGGTGRDPGPWSKFSSA